MFPLVKRKQEKHSAAHAKQADSLETEIQAVTLNIPFASLCQNDFLLLACVYVGVCVHSSVCCLDLGEIFPICGQYLPFAVSWQLPPLQQTHFKPCLY